MTYFEDDGGSGLLLQNPGEAEGLQVRVGVVHEAGVAVGEQRLDVVEDEAELVGVFDRLPASGGLGLQRRGEAADGGRVEHFAHLERGSTQSSARRRTWLLIAYIIERHK